MAKTAAVAIAICPQVSAAEGFTGKEFLTWSSVQQRSYLDAQIVMASSIVTRTKQNMANCMADEFYGASGLTDEGFKKLVDTISEYDTYHPSSVLVVVIENVCGAFY